MVNLKKIIVRRGAGIGICAFLIFGMWGCSRDMAPITNSGAQGDTIVCLGDSITKGVGAGRGEDYPSRLAAYFKYPVINAGIEGDTTKNALRRLDDDVFIHDPRIVIIFLGGNDFLQDIPLDETESALERIVTSVHDYGAMAVVVSPAAGILLGDYEALCKRIVTRYNTGFISNALSGIIDNPLMKSDRIHPNAEGYALMAQRFRKVLYQILRAKHGDE